MAETPEEKAAPPGVAEVAKAAADACMSYGKYVQRMQQQKAREQPRPPVTTCCAPAPKRPEITAAEWDKAGTAAPEKPKKPEPQPAPAPKPRHRRSKYSPEARADAVRLAMESDGTVKDVAGQVGIPYPTLCKWVQAYRAAQEEKEAPR